MKKLTLTLVSACFLTMFCVAQTKADAVKLQTPAQAAKLTMVLIDELHLTAVEQAQVNDLLVSTLKAQAELVKKDASQEENDAIMARHAMHFEGNLKAIIGEAKFKAYEALKPTLATTLNATAVKPKN